MNIKNGLNAPSSASCVVVGGGIMGKDVAFVLFRAGANVVIVETNPALHKALYEHFHAGQIPGQPEHAGSAKVAVSLDAVDWAGVDLVVECIPEDLAAKQALFKQLEDRASADAVLASNSSSFPISQIAAGRKTSARMLGLHFFMPAHVVPLVEVVLGQNTDPVYADDLAQFMRRCGCVPIMVRKDIPGFIANRLQHALGREAYSLIESGVATPEDIDAAVRFGFGFRYLAAGPIMQKEIAGLDVHAAAAATIYPTLSNVTTPPAPLADKVKEGKFGMKSGQGFYRWDTTSAAKEKERYHRILQTALAAISDDLPDIQP